jgi:uncharacterized protein YciI
MKHFIVEITYTVTFEELGETVAEHQAFLQGGYDQGWLLCSGPQAPRVGGMVVARAPSREALIEFFSNDPYLNKGLATYRWVEFEPVKHQPFLKDWVEA